MEISGRNMFQWKLKGLKKKNFGDQGISRQGRLLWTEWLPKHLDLQLHLDLNKCPQIIWSINSFDSCF